MTRPLDGARLKVVRAQKHLGTLKDEIRAYMDTGPYEIPSIKHTADKDAGVTEFTITNAIIKTLPPPDLSCIIGDCVTNLRASLDYIAWQIAIRYAASRPVVGKDRRISFPISTNGKPPDRLTELASKYSFPADAINAIESVQPHHAGYEPLAALECLVNQDKHCLLVAAIMYADMARAKVVGALSPSTQATVRMGGTTVIWTSGAGFVLPNFKVSQNLNAPTEKMPVVRAGDMEVHGEVAAFVALQDLPMPREPVDLTLENIVKCVANIIPRFDQFV